MKISLIAAVAENRVIGGGNTLLWNIPEDLKHFREKTSNHTIIMGRKTFESIGKPLPYRHNIVISRDKTYTKDNVTVVNSLEEALQIASLEQGTAFEKNQNEVEIFIIGGGEIYRQAFDVANRLYITEVHKHYEGDVTFPEINKNVWEEVFREDHLSEPIPYSFVEYKKI